jgi:WD40 repeat protein
MRHDNWVFSVEFSPDSRQLLTASSDTTARLWDLASNTQVLPPLKHESGVNVAHFSPNGRSVVTASADGTARIWDATTGQAVSEPLRHLGSVLEARFSPDGKTVITGSADHTAKIWTAISGKPIVQRLNHDQPVNGTAFSPDGKWLATIANDRTARIWDVSKGKPASDPIRSKRRLVSTMEFSPDGKHLATASEDFEGQLWDVNSGKPVLDNPLVHDGPVRAISFSPDGLWLVTASDDRQARIWEVATGALKVEPLKHDGEVTSAFFSHDGKWVVTASSDKKARVWQAATGKLVSSMAHGGEVRAVAISPDGKWIVTGSEDRTARVWDAATGNPVTTPIPHDSGVKFVAFNPSRSSTNLTILTASEKVARLWDAETGRAVTEPIQVDEAIQAISFSPKGDFVVMAYGKFARVWDNTGKPVTDVFSHEAAVRSANFSPDGNFIVTASADRAARLWPFTISARAPGWLGDLASAICGYRLDNFGAAELLPNSWEKIAGLNSKMTNDPNDSYAGWASWFLADRSTRTLSPFATTPIGDYVRERVEEGTPDSLAEALQLQPSNGLGLAKIARLSKSADEADFLSKLAELYEPENPEVLWFRADILQQWNRFVDAWAIMERAIKLDARSIASFGPDGSEFTCANTQGATSQGWLPKGWSDANTSVPFSVTYAKVSDVPRPGLSGLEIKVDGEGVGTAEVRGPRFICRRTARCTVEGWVRSATKSDVSVVILQLIEPRQKYKEQVVHTTPEWKSFKVQFGPSQDIAAEIRLLASAGGTVQLAGVSIKSE